jgi:predicted  nucleic acid-binding Zn-ribbon protein
MQPEWEFRLAKIENLLATLTERQVQQQVEISLLQESQKRTDEQIQATSEQIKLTDQQIQAVVRQIQAAEKQIQALTQHAELVFSALGRVSDSQERTEARLQSLIDTVDRLRPGDK